LNNELINSKITQLHVCVIIPTYNNQRTLKRVLDGVLELTNNIIVVNDGSTDTTSNILKDYPNIQQIHFPENKGKGLALREGFKHAISLGYQFAITIDSDGQHFPSDIPNFINELEQNQTQDILIIGSRNMEQEGVPGKSSFGNKFSNFWFWIETGIKLKDTQSGFRLYPLNVIKNLKFYTTKFEFEIEVIVKSAWKDVEVKNMPIQVLYDESERVSHFRPFKDFTRISILNTWLVFLTGIYYFPRRLFRNIKKKGVKRFLVEDFLGSNDSPKKKALSIALGTFIGFSPFWGFQTLLVITLAVFLKLNKTIAFAFSNVSLPPFIPFIIYASLELGQWVLGEKISYSIEEMMDNFEAIEHLKTYLVGSFTLAIIGAIVFGFIGYVFFSIFNKKNKALKND
jgi:glycosyltransferase involved in cell wall biosynthesis